MKQLAKVLGVISVILALIAAYLFAGTHLQVRVTETQIVAASEQPELFAASVSRLANGELGDRAYTQNIPESADDCCFVRIRVNVRSFGLLPCEWITAGVTPLAGDIALVESRVPDIGALASRQVDLWLLAEKALPPTAAVSGSIITRSAVPPMPNHRTRSTEQKNWKSPPVCAILYPDCKPQGFNNMITPRKGHEMECFPCRYWFAKTQPKSAKSPR